MSDNPMATHGAPSWIEHVGNDRPAARAFYEKVLGWTVAEMPMKDGSTYHSIKIGDKSVGGFSPMPSERGQWLCYITVDDVDARFNAAIDAGGSALQEPFSMPGVGRIAVFADPFGAVLALITYESQQS